MKLTSKFLLCAGLAVFAGSFARAQPTGNCSNVTSSTTPRTCADSQTTSTSGTVLTIQNNGGLVPSFEELFTGSPATVSVVIKGCATGGTCDVLETYTTVANSVRSPTVSKIYSYYTVTPSWTGGTSPTFTVNTYITTSRTAGSGGGGSGTVTSVAATGDGTVLNSTVTGSPITSSGTLAFSLANAAANSVLAGPSSGGAAAPTYQTAPTISAANMTSVPACATCLTNTAQVATSVNAAASTPPLLLTGSIFTGGTGTTTQPQFFIQPSSATAVTTWNTNGTLFGINTSPSFVGTFLDFRVNNAASAFNMDRNGVMQTGSSGGLITPVLDSLNNFWTIANSATATIKLANTAIFSWSSTGSYAGTQDTGLDRNAAGVVEVNLGTAAGSGGSLKLQKTLTSTACASSASPAVCSSAAAGFVVVAASATTVVVDTTAVTANSQVFVQEDSSLGTALSVTCNTTPATAPPTISARTGGTSFTITTTAPTTNPRCFSYYLVN